MIDQLRSGMQVQEMFPSIYPVVVSKLECAMQLACIAVEVPVCV